MIAEFGRNMPYRIRTALSKERPTTLVALLLLGATSGLCADGAPQDVHPPRGHMLPTGLVAVAEVLPEEPEETGIEPHALLRELGLPPPPVAADEGVANGLPMSRREVAPPSAPPEPGAALRVAATGDVLPAGFEEREEPGGRSGPGAFEAHEADCDATDDATPVSIPDPHLRALVEQGLGLAPGTTITRGGHGDADGSQQGPRADSPPDGTAIRDLSRGTHHLGQRHRRSVAA